MSVDPSKMRYDAGSLYAALLGRLSGDPAQILFLKGEDPSHLETDWRSWLTTLLPGPMSSKRTGELTPFGDHHTEFWDWVWNLQPGLVPPAKICIWPRGGGKSTSAEMAGVMVGALRKRRYVLYICETLERAEDHVDHVAEMLSSSQIARYYPHVSEPMVGKTGATKGWRRNRLRTAGGFTVDAIGLDVAARGIKIGDDRPDFIIIDDVDGETDSLAVTEAKIRKLTTKFLPAGAPDLAVLAVQNLIIRDGIFSRLAGVSEYEADFLHDREVSGPFQAVEDLTWDRDDQGHYRITGGRAIWAGMDLSTCEGYINQRGIRAFLSESQQEVNDFDGGMFTDVDFDAIRVRADDVPTLLKIECWVDPAVSETDNSDSHGIQIDGLGMDGLLYRLWSWERRSSPEEVLDLALMKAIELGATAVGVETDQGGDLWKAAYAAVVAKAQSEGRIPAGKRVPAFKSAKAGSSGKSKAERVAQMLLSYEHMRIRHVYGTHEVLERALKRFPKVKPFDLTDAAYWSWFHLMPQTIGGGKRTAVSPPRPSIAAYQPR